MRKGSRFFNSLLKVNKPSNQNPQTIQHPDGKNLKKTKTHESKLPKKQTHTNKKKNIKNKPSNAPPNNSTLTLTLRLGQDLLDHQPWLIKTRGMI